MRITHCKTDHLTNPLGYAMTVPVFSWKVENAAGKKQTAARIVIKQGGQPAADTGWTDLDSLAAPAPVPLAPRTRYTWTVSVRTDAGEEAESEENWFETAKMDEPWQAAWIGCDDAEPRHPIFSKTIEPARPVTAARLYICGLGLYEAYWNGEKIGAELLTPYCNNYDAWLQYQTYDVTAQLQTPGTLNVLLGNGWYKGRFGFDKSQAPHYGSEWKLTAELHLLYTDGTEETICTDESWQVTRSHLTFSNIYDGEHRDDTLPDVPPVPAKQVQPPAGALSARYSVPAAVREELPVRELIHTPAGETVLDIGQNMTGTFRLRVREPKGKTVRLQFGEILQDGNFYRENLRTAKAEYIYVSDGEEHILSPHFTFYGYRYIKVEGIPALGPSDFTALVVYSDLPRAGKLTTGSELVNQLIRNTEWGQKGNFLDVPTDCPQRDERMGWTGDAQVFAPTACYQRESFAFFRKYLHDMETEQAGNDGAVPFVVPSFGIRDCSAAWGDAACILPWTLYEFYGDKTILDHQYASMCAWIDYIAGIDGEDNAWRRHFHFGDWLALDAPAPDERRGGTDVGYVASALYYRSIRLTAHAARVLGKEDGVEKYEALADRVLADIWAEYFSPSGRCCADTQTGLLLALANGLTPNPARTAADLAAKVRGTGKLQTGFVGTPLLCEQLTAIEQEDMAFDLLLNEDYPGWLYAVKLGATTIWERWNSVDANGKIAENGMNSLNHYAYGSVVGWLYRDAAGLVPAEPGFRRVELRPHVSARLGHLEAVYHSAAGTWRSAWEVLENGDIRYRCTVPFGCTAKLTLPYGGGVRELTAGDFEISYTPDSADAR